MNRNAEPHSAAHVPPMPGSDEATHAEHAPTAPAADPPKASLRKIVLTSVITVVLLVGITVGGFLWKSSVPYESHRAAVPYAYSSTEFGFTVTFSDFAMAPSPTDASPMAGGLQLTSNTELLAVLPVDSAFLDGDRDELLTSLYSRYLGELHGGEAGGFNIADLNGERALSGTMLLPQENVTLDCLMLIHNGFFYSLVTQVESDRPSPFLQSFQLLPDA